MLVPTVPIQVPKKGQKGCPTSHQQAYLSIALGAWKLSNWPNPLIQLLPVADLRGTQGTRPLPSGGPNSFDFMQFLGNFGKIVCWRPLLGEILDPPLVTALLR